MIYLLIHLSETFKIQTWLLVFHVMNNTLISGTYHS